MGCHEEVGGFSGLGFQGVGFKVYPKALIAVMGFLGEGLGFGG